MKKLMMMFVVLFVGLQIAAQEEIAYGDIRKDGYGKITKGAFWEKRPEAKMIYEGSYPPGFKVYTLKEDYFVRFIDGEHNSLDINYIVFPKGEKVYINEAGEYFSAKCGNKISYIKPVEMVKIVREKEIVLVPDTIYETIFRHDTIYREVPVEDPQRFEDTRIEVVYVQQENPYYEPVYRPMFMPVMFSFPLISWGQNYGCHRIGGYDYYYNNQVTNNITNINNNISNTNTNTNVNINKWNKPTDPVDTGGPGGADTQGSGGPGGADTGNQGGNPGGAVTNSNSNPGGANTGKSASMERSNSRRSTTSFSSNSGSVKSASKRSSSSSSSRSSSYRSSSTPRSSSYRSSSTPSRSSYRTNPSYSSNRSSSSSYRSSGRSPSSSYRPSGGASMSSSRSRSSFGGGSSRSSGMSRSSGGSRSYGGGSSSGRR